MADAGCGVRLLGGYAMPARKGNNRVQTKLAQFTYDHRQLNDRMSKIRKNATELGKFLDSMLPKKGGKQEK